MSSVVATEHDDYLVGWVVTSQDDLMIARTFLDREHESLATVPGDDNTYVVGRIGKHYIVIAALPFGVGGNLAVAVTATNLTRTFSNVRVLLMVGTAGCAPFANRDGIRLGDIVVGVPNEERGAVVQLDTGHRIRDDDFVIPNAPMKSSTLLLSVVRRMMSRAWNNSFEFPGIYENTIEGDAYLMHNYEHIGEDEDILFRSDYIHYGHESCSVSCDKSAIIARPRRLFGKDPVVHYGAIGSAQFVFRDGVLRDKLAKTYGVLCFDNTSAGLLYSLPSLVIRGICDYADTHASTTWRQYAGAMAAAYAKEVLLETPLQQVQELPSRAVSQYPVTYLMRPVDGPPTILDMRSEEIESRWDGLSRFGNRTQS